MRYKVSILAILLALLLVGCATTGTQTTMTPQQTASMALQVYNNAFVNYNAQFNAAPKPLSPDMVKYFTAYKLTMTEVYPVISIYVSTVRGGTAPTPEQEQAMIEAMYRLQTLLLQKLS